MGRTNFKSEKLGASDINGGYTYTSGDGLQSSTINKLVNSALYCQERVNDQIEQSNKLDKAPNGQDNLINNNNKINLAYMPDSILGQLVYGGVVSGYSSGTLTINLSTNGINKLSGKVEILNDTIQISVENDPSIYDGLYFVVSQFTQFIEDSVFEFYGKDFTVGDWLIATANSWEKIDNTDAVQSVAGKTGAVELEIEDINGLKSELESKVASTPHNNYPYRGVETLTDKDGNVLINLTTNKTKTDIGVISQYLIKFYPSSPKLEIQYSSGDGSFKTPITIKENTIEFNDTYQTYQCTFSNYATDGSIVLYATSNICVLKFYVKLQNCSNSSNNYDTYVIATLPSQYIAVYESFGTVVSQADATAPNQSFIVSVSGDQIKLVTKGVGLANGWVLGSLTFIGRKR